MTIAPLARPCYHARSRGNQRALQRATRRRGRSRAGGAHGGAHNEGEKDEDKVSMEERRKKSKYLKNRKKKNLSARATSKNLQSLFLLSSSSSSFRLPLLRLRALGLAKEHLVRDLALPVRDCFEFEFRFCHRRSRW